MGNAVITLGKIWHGFIEKLSDVVNPGTEKTTPLKTFLRIPDNCTNLKRIGGSVTSVPESYELLDSPNISLAQFLDDSNSPPFGSFSQRAHESRNFGNAQFQNSTLPYVRSNDSAVIKGLGSYQLPQLTSISQYQSSISQKNTKTLINIMMNVSLDFMYKGDTAKRNVQVREAEKRFEPIFMLGMSMDKELLGYLTN
jgi:hypothetical protein